MVKVRLYFSFGTISRANHSESIIHIFYVKFIPKLKCYGRKQQSHQMPPNTENVPATTLHYWSISPLRWSLGGSQPSWPGSPLLPAPLRRAPCRSSSPTSVSRDGQRQWPISRSGSGRSSPMRPSPSGTPSTVPRRRSVPMSSGEFTFWHALSFANP